MTATNYALIKTPAASTGPASISATKPAKAITHWKGQPVSFSVVNIRLPFQTRTYIPSSWITPRRRYISALSTSAFIKVSMS